MHSVASSVARSRDRRGRTVSSACSSETPAWNASSPRKPAAIFSASRLFSPRLGNTPTRKSVLGIGWGAPPAAGPAAGERRRLAPVLAEAGEHADEKVRVGDRLADLQ